MNTYYGDESKINNNIYIFSFLVDEPFYSDVLIRIVTLANKYMTQDEYNAFLSDMKHSRFITRNKKNHAILKRKLRRWLNDKSDKIQGKIVVIENVGNDHHSVVLDKIKSIFPNSKDILVYDNLTGLQAKINSYKNTNIRLDKSKNDRRLQICDFLGRFVIEKYNQGEKLDGVVYLKG